MNKLYAAISLVFVLFILQACSDVNPAQAVDEDTRTSVDFNGFSLEKLGVKAWKGAGDGGEVHDAGRLFYAEGKDGGSQVVISTGKLNIVLRAGSFYELRTEVKTEGTINYFDYIAALRSGKNRDVYEKFDKFESWTPIVLLISPQDDVVPSYFGVRLYGKGKIYSKPFFLRELTKDEFLQKNKALATEKKEREQKRIEKELMAYSPSLVLAASDAPEQFKLWGVAEDAFPPLPIGWQRVPAEYSSLDKSVAERLKSSDHILFSRPYTAPVYLESLPREKELINKISAQATPGEYEPMTFSLYAAKNLKGIKIHVTDLKSDRGQVIKSSNIDIRTVNFIRKIKDNNKKTYFLMPLTLGKGPDWIDEKTSRRYWITVFVPNNVPSGLYRGTLHIEASNIRKKQMPVEFTVLPFSLLEPPIVRFMWSPYKSIHEQNEFKMYKDMAEHGMTTMMIHGEVKTRDQKIGPEDVDNIVKSVDKHIGYYNKAGFRDNPIGGISNNQIIYYWDKEIKWFKYWPINTDMEKSFLDVYRKVFMENSASKNWPEFYHYIVDEPGGMRPENLKPSAHYLNIFKKEYPQFKTFVTIGGGMKRGYDEVGMLSKHLDVTCTNYATKDVVGRLAKLKSDFWIYNGSSMNMEPVKERFFFGWFAWKAGAHGIGQWTYAWAGSPFVSVFRDGRQDYALETKGGFLPTAGLEIIREGIDDYKYIYTLSRLIKYAKESGDNAMRHKAQKAEADLRALLQKVNLNYLRGSDVPESRIVGISPEHLELFRTQVASLISDLARHSRTSWSQLKQKLKAMPEAQPIVPSEEDWKQTAPEQAIGNDLLETVKMDGSKTGWRIQIWQGQGRGDFNLGPAYQGSRSSVLTVSSDAASDNGALVLNKPNVLMKKGVRYRLSAWIKSAGVAQHAVLYAAVRAGGISDVSSEKVKGDTDWKYVWIEFTPEEDCSPQYFAVRLWGKGTVYVNKIMLQAV
ncbi:MAG: hypothetical protein JXR79_04170 [Nitrospirae bacterium]|nr:hypothetical protein [Nitrospirota bacterium]